MRSLLIFLCAFAAAAQQLPRIEGKNLADAPITLPEAAAGHPAILVLGFTHASQHQTKAWAAKLTPLYPTWSIAVLQDMPRLVRPMATHSMKNDVPADQRARFLLVFKGEKELKQAAGFQTPDDAYLLIIDKSGVVRWRFHGPLTDDALMQVKSQMAAF